LANVLIIIKNGHYALEYFKGNQCKDIFLGIYLSRSLSISYHIDCVDNLEKNINI
jgi:hypothetical protein